MRQHITNTEGEEPAYGCLGEVSHAEGQQVQRPCASVHLAQPVCLILGFLTCQRGEAIPLWPLSRDIIG